MVPMLTVMNEKLPSPPAPMLLLNRTDVTIMPLASPMSFLRPGIYLNGSAPLSPPRY